MGDTTEISWADKTFNPWIGCTNISPACDNCYAEMLAKRWKLAEWGAGKTRKRTSPENWKKPLQWERAAVRDGTRPRVFCASLADWADKEVTPTWRRAADGAAKLLSAPCPDFGGKTPLRRMLDGLDGVREVEDWLRSMGAP